MQSTSYLVYGSDSYTVSLTQQTQDLARFDSNFFNDLNSSSITLTETYCPQANCTSPILTKTPVREPIRTSQWTFSGKAPGVYYYSTLMQAPFPSANGIPAAGGTEKDDPEIAVIVSSQCCGPNIAIDMNRYEFFYGDFNADGQAGDIYAYDRGNLLLIGYDVLIPIFPGGPNSFVYYQDGISYKQPVAANIPFSSLVMSQRGVPGTDYWIKDINADGLLDIFIRGKISGGSSSLYAFGKALGFPMVGAVYDSTGKDRYASNAQVLTFDASDRNQKIDFLDKSGDAKLELVHYRDTILADEWYSVNLTGFTSGIPLGYDPAPKFVPANAVGVSQVSFTVNEQGAANIGMPITLPAGIGGVTPTVSLGYSSQSNVGSMGMGWNFSGFSMISRCPRTMLQDGGVKAVSFTSNDERCLDGQRLIKVPSKDEYRTELDSGVVIRVLGTGATAYYVAEAKDGSIKYYGNTANSRQLKSSDDNGVMGWALAKACDSTKTCIEYRYASDGSNPGAFLLTDIYYAIFPGSQSPLTDANTQVSFSYEDRPDVTQRYIAGTSITNSKRLSAVKVFNRISSTQSLQQIKRFNLYYDRVSDTQLKQQASLLMGVQECAGANGEWCLNPTKFTWSPASNEYYFGTGFDDYAFDAKWDEKSIHENDGFLSDIVPIDINGDGLNDLLWLEADVLYGTNDHDALLRGKIYDKANDTFKNGAFSINGAPLNNNDSLGKTFHGDLIKQGEAAKRLELRPFDYNSDGHMDLGVFFRGLNKLSIYLSEPMADGSWRLNIKDQPIDNNTFAANSLFADVDGDGLADIIQPSGVAFLKKRTGTLAADEPVKNAYSALTPTDFSQIPIKQFSPVTYSSSAVPSVNIRSLIPAGDFNGDGAADFILIDRQQTNSVQVNGPHGTYTLNDPSNCRQENYYAILNDGLGLKYTQYAYLGNRKQSKDCRKDYWDPAPETLAFIQVADVNGDGLSDVFISSKDATTELPNQESVYLHMNTGLGLSGLNSDGVSSSANKIISLRDMEELRIANMQIMDVDGDGYGDFTWRWTWDRSNYVMNGHSSYRRWQPQQGTFSATSKDFNTYSLKMSFGANQHDNFTTRQIYADFNGDGLPDMLGTWGANLRYFPNKAQGGLERHITQFENGLGAKTNIEYERLTSSSHYNSLWRTFTNSNPFGFFNVTASSAKSNFYTYLNKTTAPAGSQPQITTNVPTLEYSAPIPLVTKVTSDMPTATSGAGAGAASSVEYFYSHARLQPGGRGYLGFESVVSKDLISGTKSETRYRQDWPYVGLPSLTTTKTANGVITAIKSNDYTLAGSYNSVVWKTKASEASPSGGSKLFGSLIPYIKSSTEVTFALESASSFVNGLGEVSALTGSTTTSCVLPFACSTAGTTAQTVKQRATTQQEYDAFGNPLKITVTTQNADATYKHETITQNEYNDNSSTVSSVLTLPGDDRSQRTYEELGRLGNTTVTSNITRLGSTTAATSGKSSWFYYFKTGNNTGLLSSEEAFPSGSNTKGSPFYFKKTYAYGGSGVKTKVDTSYYDLDYDFAGTLINNNNLVTRSQEWLYDATNRYVDAEIKDFGAGYFDTTPVRVNVQKVLERDIFGTATKIKAVDNGAVDATVTLVTDPFGRVINSSDTTGKQSTTSFVDCRVSGCSVPGAVMLTSVTGNDGSYAYTYVDKLLRPIRKGTADIKGGGKLNYVDIEYDEQGRVKRQSTPYASGQTPDANGWSSNTYDIFGRVIASVEPNGTATGLSTTVKYKVDSKETTFEGRVRKEVFTPMGELSEVTDPMGGRLTYGYNAKSQLETITKTAMSGDTFLGATTVVTQLFYDDHGRKIGMNDPDKGSWSYKYNALGDLVWQKDGNGQVTRQLYDKYGRLERRTTYKNDGAVADHTRWFFDGKQPVGTTVSNATYVGLGGTSAVVLASANGANDELCAVAATRQHCSFASYDNQGRSTSVSQAYYYKGNSVGSYAESVQYDAIGRVQFRFDGLNNNVRSTSGGAAWNNSGTETLYGPAGHVTGTKDIRSGKTVYNAYEQNPAGQITGAYIGAAIVTNNYDSYSGLIKSQKAIVGLRSVQDIAYTWDKFDTLTSRANAGMIGDTSVKRNLNESFCYDKLNRLTHITAGSLTPNCTAAASMVYDSFGNIRTKDGVTYSYTPARPHAVSSISTGESYAYDANGNNLSTTGSTARTIKYSVFDKPYEITAGTNLTSLAYDADRNQFYQEDGKTGQTPAVVTINMGSVQKVIKGSQVQWKRSVGGAALFEETT
ncbi:MAG TPA: SpvB/TcaC N-terminal domain-containing protein, partial [Cellvibrionaceae bacterium]